MIIDELHPHILGYYKEIDKILEENHSSILFEFRRKIEDTEPKFIYLWLSDLNKKHLLPPEINEPLSNLYWSIR